MDTLNTNNSEENFNRDFPIDLEKPVDLSPDEGKADTPDNNVEEYKDTLSAINEVNNIYSPENAELLEVINQRNALLNEIKTLNVKLSNIREDVLESNKLYESFKKDFAQSVAEDNWGEKIFYALPVFDEFDANDPWIVQWCDVMRDAVNEGNRENIRNFINRNLYNSTFSLPKDIYYYKMNPNEIKDVDKDVSKLANVFSTKTWIFFKFIKDFSDHLRTNLLKSQLFDSLKEIDLEEIPSLEKIQIDEKIVLTNGDSDYNMLRYYKGVKDNVVRIIQSSSSYIAEARDLYQQVLSFRTELSSFEKQVYTTSLMDIYRLYDSVKKCITDFEKVQNFLSDSDEPSSKCCANFIYRIQRMIGKIEDYLLKAYSIKPIDIKVGEKFTNYDVLWYEVLTAEDAPNENLVECVSFISDTGFAKYDVNGDVEKTTRAAKISVYRNSVVKEN